MLNDVHLKQSNEQAIINAVIHLIKYAVKNKIFDVFLAGDLFDSRSFQRQSTLRAFETILNLFHEAKIRLHLFPGNHDKTEYSDSYSFLEVYQHHPCVQFNSQPRRLEIRGIKIDLIPFFSDDILVPMLEAHEGGDLLISHFEMYGSENNGNVSEKSSITPKLLSKWKGVKLGHYHDEHEVAPNIHHLSAFIQQKFGENRKKGFAVIYDDLSHESIQGSFREFKKISINADALELIDIKNLISEYKDNENGIRFSIEGKKSSLEAIDMKMFEGTGIDVKKVFSTETRIDKGVEMPKLKTKLEEGDVKTNFKTFCKNKELNHEVGKSYLETFLKTSL